MLTQIQQASLELEDNMAEYKSRIEAQENQIHEMQEQILHQAQQGREYETAVQHWKDKTEKYESFLAQLIYLLDSFPSDPKSIDPEQYSILVELREKLF
ncbi:MAG: hypothetical protein HC810_04725 [Acaryochloridaceae cyanobacterium RL_2_7]|nr:hypothetical protein [Acaryochloridaceae cyanobacterium RL_2_7]